MSTLGFSGMGAVLQFGGATLGEVENIEAGDETLESEKILTCDSASYFADVLAKAFDGGEISVTCIMQPDNTTGNYRLAKTKFAARASATFLLTYANGATFTISALMTRCGRPSFPDAAAVQRFTMAFTAAGITTYAGTT